VDAASLSVTGRISAPAGQFARRAVFSPDGKTVFLVAATGTSSAPARLHVADAASRTLIGQIDLPPTLTLEDLAVTPDGGLLVGASFGSLHSIDVRSGTYGGSVRVTRGDRDPAGPRSGGVFRLAMDATGSRVYLALIGDPVTNRDLIGIADVRTLEMVGEIPVRQDPSVLRPLLRISPAGDELFYARQLGTGVQVFDIRSGLELDTILVEPAFRLTELVVA
jgi:DNA-binding beta-propeller fold protein YncE